MKRSSTEKFRLGPFMTLVLRSTDFLLILDFFLFFENLLSLSCSERTQVTLMPAFKHLSNLQSKFKMLTVKCQYLV